MTGHALVRATAVVHQAIAGVHTPVAIEAEPGARKVVARTTITAERIRARVLAQAVTVAQQTLVDIFMYGEVVEKCVTTETPKAIGANYTHQHTIFHWSYQSAVRHCRSTPSSRAGWCTSAHSRHC